MADLGNNFQLNSKTDLNKGGSDIYVANKKPLTREKGAKPNSSTTINDISKILVAQIYLWTPYSSTLITKQISRSTVGPQPTTRR